MPRSRTRAPTPAAATPRDAVVVLPDPGPNPGPAVDSRDIDQGADVDARDIDPAGRGPRLPPLNALRAFHVVYRSRSLRRAGEVLRVTPQAVGQQIRLLEDVLDVALFLRQGRTIEPTESATVLAGFVQSAFSDLAEGVRRITRPSHRGRIALNVSPYFATHFLVPTLSLPDEAAAGAEIRLSTAIHLPDFDHHEVDLAIQWGYDDSWPAHETTLLLRDPKVICCTPALARRIRTAADLRDQNLLSLVTSSRLWPDLLRHLGQPARTPAHRIGFDDAATMRRATLQGIGVGLLSVIHADEDIGSGALVAPLGRHVLDEMPASDIPGFYLVAARPHLQTPPVAAFYRWLRDRDWGATAGLTAAAGTGTPRKEAGA